MVIKKIEKLNSAGVYGVNITEFLDDLGAGVTKENYVNLGRVKKTLNVTLVVIS